MATGRELPRRNFDNIAAGALQWLSDGRALLADARKFIFEFGDKKLDSGTDTDIKLVAGAWFGDNTRAERIAVSPDGKSLIACKEADLPDQERDVVIWELEKIVQDAELTKPRRLSSVPSQCQSLFFTPDGRRIVALCQPSQKEEKGKASLVIVIDAGTGKELRRFKTPVPTKQGQTVALSAAYLAVGLDDEDGTILIWDLAKDQVRRFKSGHVKKNQWSGNGVSALDFSHDGTMLVTAGRDAVVRVWDTATLKERRTIGDAYPSWIEALAVTRDGRRVACAGHGGIIRHWDLITGGAIDAAIGNLDHVSGVQISADGATAVTVSRDRQLTIWNPTTGQKIRSIPIPGTIQYWTDVARAPDGHTIVVSVTNKLLAWDMANGKEFKLPKPCASSPRAASPLVAMARPSWRLTRTLSHSSIGRRDRYAEVSRCRSRNKSPVRRVAMPPHSRQMAVGS